MINDVVKKILPLFKTKIFVETGFQSGTTYEEISSLFPLIQSFFYVLNHLFLCN